MNQSGQMMILAIMLGVLLLITGSLIVYVNQTATFHQVASAQRSAARAVAQEGIAYAINELSANSTTWQNALNNQFSQTDCNVPLDMLSPSGGHFQLQCSGPAANSKLQPYEVAVTATAMSKPDGTGAETPLRAIQAFLSERTLGVDLASNVHAGAAIQMLTQPIISGALTVHWGPLVSLDSNPTPWTLLTPLDDQRYPRKFSQGGITGAAYSRSGNALGSGPITDQIEYWAYAPQNISPLIDEATYMAQASSTTITTPPTDGNGNSIPSVCPNSAYPQCGYFQPGLGMTAVFDGGFTVPMGAVIYVNGNAQFNNVALDSVTFIVTGNLTINNSTTPNSPTNLHVPVTAPQEYPYAPVTPTAWPCPGPSPQPGPGDMSAGAPVYDCASNAVFTSAGNSGNVQFRGFLYVKNNLIVNAGNWNMVGSLLVGDLSRPGGQLQVQPNAALNVAYDDIVNHSILVLPVNGAAIRLEPDLMQDVPTQ